ncbi:PH domain-containing protein [Bacillus toyonensis]|uniref:PH domain-containing protein n=1 Tax=Bacillus toyonensis TaxID=155322 RepID=UPI001907D229|nr:PH domain-containing protein [Bacillus toyonensis]QQN83935.1 PH domain-containing protein [Bacillus toyonensis]
MNELLSSMKKYVEDDEKILAVVVGIFEKDDFTVAYRHGIFAATTRRLLFYGKFSGYPAIFEEYPYLHIDDIDLCPYFEFTCNHERVRARYIQKGNAERFVRAVRENMNN